MKYTCMAKGHVLPRGCGGTPPPNMQIPFCCILSIEIRFKICGKRGYFSHQNKKIMQKVTKFIRQHTTDYLEKAI
jgi:hypothetical protein